MCLGPGPGKLAEPSGDATDKRTQADRQVDRRPVSRRWEPLHKKGETTRTYFCARESGRRRHICVDGSE